MEGMQKKKKLWGAFGITFGILMVAYVGASLFFMDRFHYNSIINGVEYGGKTVEEVEASIAKQVSVYTLSFLERGGQTETILSRDIGLQYVPDGTVQKLIDKQNPFAWLPNGLKREEHQFSVPLSFDQNKLKERFNALDCFNPKNVVKPVNAGYEYSEDGFAVTEEVVGNQVLKDKLYSIAISAIELGITEVSLEEEDCYKKPKLTSTNKKLIAAVDTMNHYMETVIEYDFGDRSESLDKATIKDWMTIDEKMKVSIDEDKVRDYVKTLELSYNTLGKDRVFKTTAGKKVTVKSGNYGWMISRSREVEAIMELLGKGEKVKREPEYALKGVSRNKDDIGSTYVEIDLTGQKMWFYKNGKKLVETPIVTGNIGRGWGTPAGVYCLTYKERNATLNGENYSTPVNYWMPFNGNIGIHDATWRSRFGGDIYKTGGSHGCVNTPFKNAKIIYENISAGIPVICYE